jgi:FkbM family methyltransferase
VPLPWRVKWTLAQFIQPNGYRNHAAVLQSPSSFYLATLEKLIPGLSWRVKYLALTDGHVVPVRDFMTLYIYKEIFVDRCYDLSFERSAPVIVDIGANSGLFALRIKQLCPSAQIYCYEPYPPNFEQLRNTIALNKLDSVTPIQKAVGARRGSAKLFIHKRNIGGHSFYAAEASSDNYVDVEVIDLASVLDGLQHDIDLLKIDCEGAEFDILMNLTTAAAKKIRQIILETTPGLYDATQLKAQMISLGYHHQMRQGLCVYTLKVEDRCCHSCPEGHV